MLHLTMLVALAATTQYGYYPAQSCAGGSCGVSYAQPYAYQQPAAYAQQAPRPQAYQYNSYYYAPQGNAAPQPAAPTAQAQAQAPAPVQYQPQYQAQPYAQPAYSYYQSYYYPAGSSCAGGSCGR
jgi:hypothetical protein